MAIKIGHAVRDENGKARGGQLGDQDGKEILVAKWYKRTGGWGYYLECRDTVLADKAAGYMERICAGNFGYSQDSAARWSGYKAIVAAGKRVEAAVGDFDCSSLCLSCYLLAGLKHAASGYTGSMRKSLLATGLFTAYSTADYLNADSFAKRGGLYLTEGAHVLMCLENGAKATQTISTSLTPPYVEVTGGSVNVRKQASTSGALLFTAHRGDQFRHLGFDGATGWYKIKTGSGEAYISNGIKYTRLVM